MMHALVHEQLFLGGAPIGGFGDTACTACSGVGSAEQGAVAAPTVAAVGAASPWALALTTSVVGAATGWVIQEIAHTVRGSRRGRGGERR